MQFSLDHKRRRHKQNQCSASDSVGLIFTRSYRSTLLIGTPTTTPSLVKTSLYNLQLLTHRENCKKSANNRDYSFISKNPKCVKATNKNTNEVTYFKSLYAVRQHLDINAGAVKIICDCTRNIESAVSKKDGCSYTFEYIKQDELPANHIKSKNIRPKKVSDEDKKKHHMEAYKKWLKKEFKCQKCEKVYKNSYKFAHNKKCNSQKQ